MAKCPIPGQTKSRLIPPFAPETAARLYECFLKDALDLARSVPGVVPIIAYTPVESEPYFQELAPDLPRVPQLGATLGDRLDHVLTHGLRAGYHRVAAINSDSPSLPVAYLDQALQRLAEPEIDIVLGPCEDGGYYLIGWKAPHPALVRGVAMSTPDVLEDTLALARAENLRVALAPTWYDVDTIADLERLDQELEGPSPFGHHTRAFLATHPSKIKWSG